MIRNIFLILCLGMAGCLHAGTRWQIAADGSLMWHADDSGAHYDHIEMSGEQVSVVYRYGINADKSFAMERSVVWPMLRTVPDNTHASLTRRFAVDFVSMMQVNGQTLNNERVEWLKLDGKLTVRSRYTVGHTRGDKGDRSLPEKIELTRTFFPSVDKPMACEQYTIKNISDETLELMVPRSVARYATDPQQGVNGSYTLMASLRAPRTAVWLDGGDSIKVYAAIQGFEKGEKPAILDPAQMDAELEARNAFVEEVHTKLKFISPDNVLNTMFAFAKVRAAESIFRTEGGLMHSPGGEAYYAAMWTNDQAEYVNPFFPFLGYNKGNEAAVNCYLHFARFMNAEFKPLPSSVIAEGRDSFSAAGDRGDGAMVAYGATRFALALGRTDTAHKLWPLIEWCLACCKHYLNGEGVVTSDSDELENRFPAGEANLCTSVLYYDALISASYLASDLGKKAQAVQYRKEAKELRKCIANYFEATVEGFDTYQYYKGNTLLRSWICMPLVAGIFDRKQGTNDALLSPKLWTSDGLLTQSGTNTYWDRSLLYALRGIYAAGEREQATAHFHSYSEGRLLGEHVPYPVEAWPEGNQRHLSAENGLYCRVVTEGLFGIRPTGLHRFDLTPQLPDAWDKMELQQVYAFGSKPFDLRVERKAPQSDRLVVTISCKGKTIWKRTVRVGETVHVSI